MIEEKKMKTLWKLEKLDFKISPKTGIGKSIDFTGIRESRKSL